jgi:lambda family phage portal protein
MSWVNRAPPKVKIRAKPKMQTLDSTGMASVMRPEVETTYHGASRAARDMASWPTIRYSPDAALLGEQDTLNARIEDLTRNNGLARGHRKTLADNVIGPKITCKPNPDRVMLGKPPEWSREWSQQVESQWNTFADTTWFDAGGRHTFHSATRLAIHSLATNGEAIALPLWIQGNGRGDSSRWFTRLQLVHPARLSNPNLKQDNAELRSGIELDRYGGPAAYWFRKTHPGDFGVLSAGLFDWERIPAYTTWGRVRVIHLYAQEDVGQSRGIADMVGVLRQFRMLDKYQTEELRAAVLNSLVFAAVETPMDQQGIADLFGTSDGSPMDAYYNMVQEWRVNMQGGTMIPLPPGTQMKPFSPARPNGMMEGFVTVMLRNIAAGLNIPYELLFRDFSKTNYSSARAAMLEAWRYFMSVRQLFIDHWIRVIFDLWFEEAVNRGRIPDCTPQDYYMNQVAWTRAKWYFAPRGWVDPLKEARGLQTRMAAGLLTLEEAKGEEGVDWIDFLEQKKRENDHAAELGLPLPHTDTKAAAAGGGGDSQNAVEDAVNDGGNAD